MFRRFPHPLYRRQWANATEEKPREMQTAEDLKLEAAVQDIQAAGLFQHARLAQAWVVWQQYGAVFSPMEALEKGTIFPDLYSPYPY